MRGNYIKIDPAKLREELKKHGLTISGASRAIGFTETYLSKALRLERLSKSGAISLAAVCGIKSESYEAVEPEPALGPKAFVSLTQTDRRLWQMTIDELYRVIYAALRHANRDSMSLNSRND